MEEMDMVLHRDCREALTVRVKLDENNNRDYTSSEIRFSKYSSTDRTSLRLVVIVSVLIVILSLCSGTSAMPSAFLCQMDCKNGGKMHVPDGPFAYCMCICPRQYVGLRCEFNKMISYTPRRIRKVNRLKRLVKIRNEVKGLLSEKKRRRHRHFQR